MSNPFAKIMVEQEYMEKLLDAYRKGYAAKYSGTENPPEFKKHYFKRKEPMDRVAVVMSYITNMVWGGRCRTMLDVGSGRGAFLFPFLEDPANSGVEVTSIDMLPRRTELLELIRDGGLARLHPVNGDICAYGAPDGSFDAVTALEVLEHIPDPEAAVRNMVRLCSGEIVVSVPSKPDDNPEHINLFTYADLEVMFMKAGCRRVWPVSHIRNHLVIAAAL